MIKVLNKLTFFLKKYRHILIILFIAFILRLIYFLFILYNFGDEGFYLSTNGDAIEYLKLAKQWLQSGTFQNLYGLNEPEVFRTPGYPLFIAFFYNIFSGIYFLILVQNIIYIITGCFFYDLVQKLFQNNKISIIAVCLFLFEPSSIYWNNQLITETLFLSTLLIAIYFSFKFYNNKKINNIALSGFFLGISIFIRPAGEYLALIFVLLYLLLFFKNISFKKIILSILIFSLSFLLILSPLMIRNKYIFDSYSISNSSTIAFGKYFTAMKNKLGDQEEILVETNPFKHSKIVKKNTIFYIVDHPIIFLQIYFASLVPFFFGDAYLSVFSMVFPELESMRVVTDWKGDAGELLSFLKGHNGVEAFVFFSGKIIWLFFTILAFFGLYYSIKHHREKWPQLVFFIFLIMYFSLASGIGSYSRFRFPVNPYIFIFASLGIHYIFKKIKITNAVTRYNTKSR